MKVFKYFIIGVALAGISVLTSCKKEGCSDSAAINYNIDVKKDDGSCKFQGEAILWYDEETSNELTLTGSSNLEFYVDEKLVGSTSASVYWESAPNCGANGSITVTKDLGVAKNKSFNFYVKNNLGIIIDEGLINFEANACNTIEIVN